MIMLRNPYEGIWEKYRSIDDMDMILESRTAGTSRSIRKRSFLWN